jgi:hypothetical protein
MADFTSFALIGKQHASRSLLVAELATVSPVVGRNGIYRRPRPRGTLFVSIASAAESFRSTCGSERRAPECSTQRTPGAAPHVGQETEDNCFAVRSLFFILRWCDKTGRKTVPFRTLYARSSENWSRTSDPRVESTVSTFLDPWDEKVCRFYETFTFPRECSRADLLSQDPQANGN